MILNGSKLKTRKFSYSPRYYDPEKEKRDLRKKINDQEMSNSVEGTKTRISSSFARNKERNVFLSGDKRRFNTRIIAIFFCLMILAYFFVQYVFPQILLAVTK